jgi:hypothetical protein
VTEVDERDSHWEDDQPTFRVYLHASETTSTVVGTATLRPIALAQFQQRMLVWRSAYVGIPESDRWPT